MNRMIYMGQQARRAFGAEGQVGLGRNENLLLSYG